MGAIITHPMHWGKITPMPPTKKQFFTQSHIARIYHSGSCCFWLRQKARPRRSQRRLLPSPPRCRHPCLPLTGWCWSHRPILIPCSLRMRKHVLRELAASSALEFERREQVIANEITSDIKVMVFLNQPENLGSLASGAPGTQFVAIMDQDWNPGQNVTVIRRRDDHTAFMAGYLAALIGA